tara:strand:+ start:124 stop:639 length:516 start_codon:yes stop_codon:yes gene_type:complete
MGAEQSYQKKDSSSIDFNGDIEDLHEYLKPLETTKLGKEYDIDNIDLDKYSLYDLLQKSASKQNINKIKLDSELLDKIKMSLDMYVLYDNYNLKHKVLVTDLSKKLENQNKEIKGKSEEIDTLIFKIKDIKNNSKKNSNIKLLILIGIIILVILIPIICIFIYLKFIANNP